MKKLLLLAFALFFISVSHATSDTVKISNFQFSPASINATVGDTIVWILQNGFHTTTSTSVPARCSSAGIQIL